MRVVMLPGADLAPTGRSVARDEVYTGEVIRVSRDGRILSTEIRDQREWPD
jgi:hypothetical protein